jgi:hypothetical protein
VCTLCLLLHAPRWCGTTTAPRAADRRWRLLPLPYPTRPPARCARALPRLHAPLPPSGGGWRGGEGWRPIGRARALASPLRMLLCRPPPPPRPRPRPGTHQGSASSAPSETPPISGPCQSPPPVRPPPRAHRHPSHTHTHTHTHHVMCV